MKIILNSGVVNTRDLTRINGFFDVVICNATYDINNSYVVAIESGSMLNSKTVKKCATKNEAKKLKKMILDNEAKGTKILDLRN